MPAKAGIQNYLKTQDSRLRRYFIKPIYLSWFDFFKSVRPNFSHRFTQNLGPDLFKELIAATA